MPWFPEFSQVLALAETERAASSSTDRVRRYVEAVHAGRTDDLALGGDIVVHDPRAGRLSDPRELADFMRSSAERLSARNARTEWVATTATRGRAVGELVVRLQNADGEIALPIAVVAEVHGDGIEFRTYYSQWPLSGRHSIRPPILAPGEQHPGDVVGRYHAALRAGDADTIVECFEPTGYFREPAGAAHVHRGTDELRAFFTMFFSEGGGIYLEHCAVTDDGTRCALEYNCVRWGQVDIPPQSGVAAYERGTAGRLVAARIYDDVEPPMEDS